jgi:hypothetical protein
MTKITPKLVGILGGSLITLAACGTSAIEKPAGADPPAAATAVSDAHLAPTSGTLHSAGIEPTDHFQLRECTPRAPKPC